jgi:hypothetical protein
MSWHTVLDPLRIDGLDCAGYQVIPYNQNRLDYALDIISLPLDCGPFGAKIRKIPNKEALPPHSAHNKHTAWLA